MAVVSGIPGFTQFDRLNLTDELRVKGVPILPAGNVPAAVLSAQSTAVQSPTALNTPIQVNFGAAQGGPSDAVQIDAAGTVTFNQDGVFQAIALFSPERSTSGGESVLFIRALINDVQFQNPAGIIIDDDEFTIPLQFVGNRALNAGDTLKFEFYRDSAGENNGSLATKMSNIGWGSSSSASLQIFQFA